MERFDSHLFKNARIWDGERFMHGDVLVRDGIITAVGECPEVSEDIAIWDCSGKLLTPGLLDIHSHLRHISCDKYGMDAALATIPFGLFPDRPRGTHRRRHGRISLCNDGRGRKHSLRNINHTRSS